MGTSKAFGGYFFKRENYFKCVRNSTRWREGNKPDRMPVPSDLNLRGKNNRQVTKNNKHHIKL